MSQPGLSELDELIDRLSGHQAPAPAPAPVHASVDTWVREIFLTLLGDLKVEQSYGSGNAARWCPRWWAHPLALDRLCSLWRAWEALRLDPGTGISSWYSQHFVPALADLTGDNGPFRRCGPDRHEPSAELQAIPMPEGIAAQFRDAAPPVG